MQARPYAVFDFETTSKYPHTTEPASLSCIMLDANTLEEVGRFSSLMRPLEPDKIEDEALAVNHLTREELALAPHPKQVWIDFTQFVNLFNSTKNHWNAPIAVAHNLYNFDMIISNRMCQLYGPLSPSKEPMLFNKMVSIDTIPLMYTWFAGSKDPAKIGLDALRKFFGFSEESKAAAHTSIGDVEDLVTIFRKFMIFQKTIAKKTKFAGAMKGIR